MPALFTHYLCGNAVLKLIEDENIGNSIIKHRNVFNLGTQGPDIFLYYRAWPWTNNEGIPKLGNRMHEEKTGEFICEALQYLIGSDKVHQSILTAYMCGYLCHYALDCHTHPYIFYKSGFVRRGGENTSKYTCYHRMFETALDVLMLKRELNKKPSDFKSYKQIQIQKETAAAIGDMYSKILKKVYSVDLSPELVCRSINDMIGITAVLRDTTAIKKKLLYSIEKALGKQPMFSSMILPLEINDGLDYLNTSHFTWHLPWDNSAALTSSFTEGFEAAVSESKKLVETISLLLSGKIDLENVMALIGNRSFSTGEDCSLNLEFKYFDCIYE